MAQNHYQTLDVPVDATAEEIKAAYREAAAREHPDRGGSTEAMALVNVAYDVLSNPAKRRRYDRGEAPRAVEDTPERKSLDYLAAVFHECLEMQEKVNFPFNDWLTVVKKKVWSDIQTGEDITSRQDRGVKRAEKLLKRLKYKGPVDIVRFALEGQLTKSREQLTENQAKLGIAKRAYDMLKDFDLEKDPVDPQQNAGLAAGYGLGLGTGGILGGIL